MIEEYIKSSILENFAHEPTSDQQDTINKLGKFILEPGKKSVFILKGYAGTGKTYIISALIKALKEIKIKTVLMAPTGKAAKVLSKYSKEEVSTIHKKIYRQKSMSEAFSSFGLDRNMHKDTIFIVDEASMIGGQTYEKNVFGTGSLLDDLFKYIQSGMNCKLILIGDTAQLPPVGLNESPALEDYNMQSFAKCYSVELKDVVRQKEKSGILFNATRVRNMIMDNNINIPTLKVEGFPDIESISGADLIEKISDAYSQYGIEQTMVICKSNKRANIYNQGIRNSVVFAEDELVGGDRLMVVKNNYQVLGADSPIDFIANGDILVVKRIRKYYERYGMRYAEASLQFEDYEDFDIDTNLLLDVLSLEAASLPYEKTKELFFSIEEDYSNITEKKKRYLSIREDPFFNALQIKFAYAITCHKAQGGEWDCIFIDKPYWKDDIVGKDDLRWLYTAITRASKKIYLVNFDKKYLE